MKLDRESEPASLVIDVTYRCNARCRYCRWGDGRTAERADRPMRELCVDRGLLRSANIKRVVFSGGEPLLHGDLSRILGYYADAGVSERIVITNGLAASPARIQKCHAAGATGFAFSIDTADADIAAVVRGMSAHQHARILRHFEASAGYAATHGLEFTINCVLSSANCDPGAVRRLVSWASSAGASAIKFQPIFDDGYLGRNAPELQLRSACAGGLRAIGADAESWGIPTNPPAFFSDLATMLDGVALPGTACRLAGRSYVLLGAGLVICPWIPPLPIPTPGEIPRAIEKLGSILPSCSTGPHCFCLQPRDQRWFNEVG